MSVSRFRKAVWRLQGVWLMRVCDAAIWLAGWRARFLLRRQATALAEGRRDRFFDLQVDVEDALSDVARGFRLRDEMAAALDRRRREAE